MIEGLLLGGLPGSSGGKLLGSDEVIKLGFSYGNVLGTILQNVDGIKISLDVGAHQDSFDEYFNVLVYCNLEGLLLGDSLGSTDSKMLGSDEGI